MNENLIEQFITKKSQWVIDKPEYFKSFPVRVFERGNKKDFSKRK